MSRRWKILFLVVAGVIALVGLRIGTLGVGPEKEVEAYKKSLIAHGEKLDISEVLPPSVPSAQNGADIFNEAVSLTTPEGEDWRNIAGGMLMIAPGKAMASFEQPDVDEPDFTNSWLNLIAVAEENRPATELLEQAADFPALDFHVDYTRWPETPTTYLAPLKQAALRLSTDASCHLHQGDAASAATNICAMVGLVNGERDERLLISQLVRFAMASIAASATWEFLQSTNVNDEELAMLQTRWEQSEYVHSIENSLLVERAGNEATIKKMRESEEYFNDEMSGFKPSGGGGGSGAWTDDIHDFWDNVKFGYASSMYRASWTYSDELQMLQGDQIMLDTVRSIETNGCFNQAYADMNTQLQSMGMTNEVENSSAMNISDIRWMFSKDGPDLYGAILHRAMTAEVTKNIVITAIALKRYQLKYGGYPDALSKLVPQFLSAVPPDPVDGKQLRYRLNADGTFLLYSIGLNGKDDGGNPSLDASILNANNYWLSPHALDWVWPQPATPAEIQYFYAHPPR